MALWGRDFQQKKREPRLQFRVPAPFLFKVHSTQHCCNKLLVLLHHLLGEQSGLLFQPPPTGLPPACTPLELPACRCWRRDRSLRHKIVRASRPLAVGAVPGLLETRSNNSKGSEPTCPSRVALKWKKANLQVRRASSKKRRTAALEEVA